MAGSSPFNVISFFVTELAEYSEKHLGKTPLLTMFRFFPLMSLLKLQLEIG